MATGISTNPYVSVYEVLDQACFSGGVAARTQSVLSRALEDLRCGAAPAEHIDLVQLVSVALHKLNWATLNGDAEEGEATRAELQALGAQWLQMPLSMN